MEIIWNHSNQQESLEIKKSRSQFLSIWAHINREHTDVLGKDLYKQGIQLHTNIHDDKTLLSTSYDTQLDLDTKTHDGDEGRN